ncbi:hypothetical protein GIY23_22010 [Allosaccharopolyspora coralli]|uniref:Uncharacterized protein n=1 Tax=Allosaccharopolyspora coralli TaxID=2665642 RepID=A0A5Q3QJW3_9PSEU|nr:hypothetical protein [Allosaccharopolyspora coralli]QGK71825.1 hypothetical protein GIY23_22010 [Allosaccharopolyspora coralli]
MRLMDPDGTSVDDIDRSPALVLDEATSAVCMPADLAVEVDRILSLHLLPGAVIQDGDEWIFLTQPIGSPYRLPDDVRTLDVRVLGSGQQVPLPAPPDSLDTVRWLRERDAERHHPPVEAIVCAVRRALFAHGPAQFTSN